MRHKDKEGERVAEQLVRQSSRETLGDRCLKILFCIKPSCRRDECIHGLLSLEGFLVPVSMFLPAWEGKTKTEASVGGREAGMVLAKLCVFSCRPREGHNQRSCCP